MIETMLLTLGVPAAYAAYGEVITLVLFVASEVIGVSPAKDNSVAQFVVHAAKRLKPHSKQDERIDAIARELRALRRETRFPPIDTIRRGTDHDNDR